MQVDCLDPDNRTLYSAHLEPPSEYVFDSALATTYTLDFETALSVPVNLALFAAQDRDEQLLQPLLLLEGAERIADRLVVYTQAGHIAAQQRPGKLARICSLLEKYIVEVMAPKGGAFHPKIWAIRYRHQGNTQAARMRLLILSRNLTRDRSWDIALSLDGTVTDKILEVNRPLERFIASLPELALHARAQQSQQLTNDIAAHLLRTKWELPKGFDHIAFATTGMDTTRWMPAACARLGIISPFCDRQTLEALANRSKNHKPILISRIDQLNAVDAEFLKERFEQVRVLSDAAATESGDDHDPNTLQGLHAKIFVAEDGSRTRLTIGSGNATRPALLNASNVEIFATLSGDTKKVGDVQRLLGPEGFGRLTETYTAAEVTDECAEQTNAERQLSQARDAICRALLILAFDPVESDKSTSANATDMQRWSMRLTRDNESAPENLTAISNDVTHVRIWPITTGEIHAREGLKSLRESSDINLGSLALADLTKFVSIELRHADGKSALTFTTALRAPAMPEHRHAAIVRDLVNDRNAFFRYLRLLLADDANPFMSAMAARATSAKNGGEVAPGDAFAANAPLLEELLNALIQESAQNGKKSSINDLTPRSRLKAVDDLITRLGSGHVIENVATHEDPIPAEFRALWNEFRQAMQSTGVSRD